MSLNGISTLPTKEERQAAKLALAAENRAASGRRDSLAIGELPATYSGNVSVPQNHTGGLIQGRPWISATFSLTEHIDTNGYTITETNIGPLIIEARATSYQVSPHVRGYIRVNGKLIKTTFEGSRGHTLAVLSPSGSVVGSIVTYDTFGTAGATTALASALNGVASGNYIAMVSWDACSVDTGIRSALTNSYGATQTTTWAPTRYSHIFIGVRV